MLALCQGTDSSKYTGDLMEVVFGSDVLASHVLKGIKGRSKTSVLDPLKVRDIEAHVALKFGVDRRNVRYAMRLKLNYMHKLYKRRAAFNES
ncbi:hypothetical protein JTE90_008275 [Oedothorax gibbosus]|uniref:BEN domain-containing protein n=1 Tax=Oedothorax gibbosus TaxID=931172 RepID=A0AAV6UI65_9ARAC|nr:hypothetical protein JTE90_008275 [Oedothorax gibbosus]